MSPKSLPETAPDLIAPLPSQWIFQVPLKGGIGSIFDPPEGKDYKWYISGIYCQLGDYMPPTTF